MHERVPVVAVDKVTGEVVEKYTSVKVASIRSGVPESSIAQQCRVKSLSPSRTCFRRADEHDPHEDLNGKANRAVVALEDGAVAHVFDNAEKAAESLYCSPATVRNSIAGRSRLLGRFDMKRVDRMGQFGEEVW